MSESALHEAPAAFPANPDAPLGPLSLSLSGGGYRAAGFHLGVVGLLDDVGLTPSVTSLSTVSGGTIFGAAWGSGRSGSGFAGG
jgi:predicted acylesterase/phospholipase RssA